MATPTPEVEEFNPHTARILHAPVSNFGTLLHFLKGSIGTGILAMPKGFTYTGFILGSVATFLTALLCSYGLNLLVASEYLLCKRLKIGYLSYSEAMITAVADGPSKLKWFSKTSGFLVNSFLVAYQLGMCSVYMIFVSRSVKLVVDEYRCEYFELTTYMCIFLGLFFLINLVPNLQSFVVFSGIATAMMLAGLGIIFYYIFSTLPPELPVMPWYGDPARWVMFVGICLFAIESVGVVVHAENHMENPQDFSGCCGILNIALAIVGFIYWFLGFFGFWRFGAHVSGSVTFDMPTGLLAQVVQILFACALVVSYGLQCFPAIDIIWSNYVVPRFSETSSKSKLLCFNYILRTLLVVVTFLAAVAFKNFLSIFIGFIGVVCLSMLGFSFPAFMHICVLWPEQTYGRCHWVFYKDVFLIILGLFLMILGSYTTIIDIIDFKIEQNTCNVTLSR